MKYYYIKSISSDYKEISLTGINTEDNRVLSREDLEQFTKENTVIGYNRITKTLSVSTLEEVVNWLKAKIKLLSRDNTDYHIEISDNHLVAEPTGILHKRISRHGLGFVHEDVVLTLTMPKLLEEIITEVQIDWVKYLKEVADTELLCCEIVIDFAMPEIVNAIPLDVGSIYPDIETLEIRNITVTDRFNLERTKKSSNLFFIYGYHKLVYVDNETKFITEYYKDYPFEEEPKPRYVPVYVTDDLKAIDLKGCTVTEEVYKDLVETSVVEIENLIKE